MKLAPVNPTFLQERDAIIAASLALPVAPEASADADDVREGFRRRGMGFSATVTSPGVVTEAFDTGEPDFFIDVTPSTQSVCAGSPGTYTVNITTQLGFTGPSRSAQPDCRLALRQDFRQIGHSDAWNFYNDDRNRRRRAWHLYDHGHGHLRALVHSDTVDLTVYSELRRLRRWLAG